MKNIIDPKNKESYDLSLDSSITVSVEFYCLEDNTEFVIPSLHFGETEGDHVYMSQSFGPIHKTNIELFMSLVMAMYDETKSCSVCRWVNVWKNEDEFDIFFYEFGRLSPSENSVSD